MPEDTTPALEADITLETHQVSDEPEANDDVPAWVTADPKAAYKALTDARKEAEKTRLKLRQQEAREAQEAEERKLARMTAVEKAE